MHPAPLNLPTGSLDIFVVGILTALFLVFLGLLIGYQLGRHHRRQTYRRIRTQLEEEIQGWKGAYKDAIGRIRRQSPL